MIVFPSTEEMWRCTDAFNEWTGQDRASAGMPLTASYSKEIEMQCAVSVKRIQ